MNILPQRHDLQVVWRLGLRNIFRVAAYRLGLRSGLHPVTRIRASLDGKDFYSLPEGSSRVGFQPLNAWNTTAPYFGRHSFPLSGGKPAWLTNPFNGASFDPPLPEWWRLPDFNATVGDIKAVWEPSRFDWVVVLAQRVCAGETSVLESLNAWLQDWCRQNPAYDGPNWKCGQESAIRVMHLALAARFLKQDDASQSDLITLIDAHLRRIEPTLGYALAQDNNHGTSEAAGLFIGGLLCRQSRNSPAQRWIEKGRRTLEQRVQRLLAPDGCFSQYSVNYHRLALDTLCMAECWRRWYDQPEFSQTFYQRAKAAAWWLFSMVVPETGDAPNIGSNDGANLLPLCDADYRDYRPSVQTAMALFDGSRAYKKPGIYDLPLRWLDIGLPEMPAGEPGSAQYDGGGYAVLRNGPRMAAFKYPRYRFRPSHCDALHVDLWNGAENLLCDAGSYSYHAEQRWMEYFPGAAAHNTIQFDDRDQMPRLGRFLRGAWLETNRIETLKQTDDEVSFAAGYRDWQGASHFRRLCLGKNGLRVEDHISGFAGKAVLRWRLSPGNWQLENFRAHCDKYALQVNADVHVVRCDLIQGWESRYYMEKTSLPVLEIEVHAPGRLVTEVQT